MLSNVTRYRAQGGESVLADFDVVPEVDALSLSEVHAAALAFWERKRGGRRAPSRAEISPAEMKPWLHWVMLTEVHEGSPLRFRRRLVGTGITGAVRRDVTGKYFEQIYEGETLLHMQREYARCANDWSPTLFHGGTPTREGFTYNSILLPLSDDGRRVNMVLSVSQFLVKY